MPDDIAQLITAIHAAPQRLVYVFAGAGALALYWLHAIPGSSRTVLEARDCYALASLAEIVGGPPAQAVSAETAQRMAQWAARRAATLTTGEEPLLGVACTAAIATNRQRRGADRAWIAVAGLGEPITHELILDPAAGRLAQEAQVSRLVVDAIANACAAG